MRETTHSLIEDVARLIEDHGFRFGSQLRACKKGIPNVPLSEKGLFPKAELSDEFATIYVTFREIKDGDVAKCVQRMVAASCDYDAAGKLIGVEIFGVLPEPA